MRGTKFAIFCIIAILLQGCTASVTSIVCDPQIRLSRHYQSVAIITNGTGSTSNSIVCNFDGQLNQVKEMNGNQQVVMATKALAFECGKLGFRVVSLNENPDLLIEFMIGSIRFDEIAGWIADAGYVTVRDAKSNQVIAQYEAKTTFITPTVNNIISSLISEMKNIY